MKKYEEEQKGRHVKVTKERRKEQDKCVMKIGRNCSFFSRYFFLRVDVEKVVFFAFTDCL